MAEQQREPVRALSFGSVAERYERYRPGYPAALVDAVLRHAGRPVRSALEVGAGTGKATRLFAARGIEVTALEPDAAMAQLTASSTRGLPVDVLVTPFERFATARRFDLVYAAAAWHWTEPATRWARAVELLAPGGVLALFGTPADPADAALAAAVAAVEAQVLPEDDPADVHPWSTREMAAADGLVDTVERHLPATATTTAADFLGRLSTVSAYLVLGPDEREDALRRVEAVLPDRFVLDATVQLSMGRRA